MGQDSTRNKHYQCALVQADGHLDLENNRNPGDEGDFYKAKTGVALSHATTPSSQEWDGTDSRLQIRDITAPDHVIGFSVGTTPPENVVHAETWPNLVIPDNEATGISSILSISANGGVTLISVSIEIIHSWISDLKVSLRSPAGTNVVLHDHEGDNGDDIIQTWTSVDFVELQRLHGEDVQGK